MATYMISGAAGRMGTMVRGLLEREKCCLVDSARIEGVSKCHQPFGWNQEFFGDVIIDFSSNVGVLAALGKALELKIPIVIGTTGLTADTEMEIKAASEVIPVSHLPNFSQGVNVLFQLVAQAAKLLGTHWQVEVVEIHHEKKKDAPSGTAKKLAEIVANVSSRRKFVCGREGQVGERTQDEIGVLALRGGDVVGEHQVIFFGPSERLILEHRAHSRMVFAAGAIKMADWLIGQRPGMYTFGEF